MGTVGNPIQLLKSYPIADQVDDIASADPPAYLHRLFAEAVSEKSLSLARVQQIAVCAMVVDAVNSGREYPGLEPELMADWREHLGPDMAKLKAPAAQALRASLAPGSAPGDAIQAAELKALIERLEAPP
jgi:hypothetical protein